MNEQNFILVVTPSPKDYSLIVESLAPDGVEVRSANCLLEAVLHLVSGPAPSVVVYDTDTPEEWRAALKNFRRIRHESRVVLVSRLADDQMWMDVLDYGGHDLLMKPFQPMEIRTVVRGALTHSVAA